MKKKERKKERRKAIKKKKKKKKAKKKARQKERKKERRKERKNERKTESKKEKELLCDREWKEKELFLMEKGNKSSHYDRLLSRCGQSCVKGSTAVKSKPASIPSQLNTQYSTEKCAERLVWSIGLHSILHYFKHRG